MKRASGSLVEALGSFFLASSLARVLARPALRLEPFLSNVAPVLNDALLALARIFVPSTAISVRLTSPSATSAGHALRQQPIEDLDAVDPQVGEPVMVQRHAARQPAIGGVALGKPLSNSRAEPTPSTVA
jgi:hypothetical protein